MSNEIKNVPSERMKGTHDGAVLPQPAERSEQGPFPCGEADISNQAWERLPFLFIKSSSYSASSAAT